MSVQPFFLFAVDLDGTLLPNTGKPAAPGCLERTRELLQTLRDSDISVCFVTGRYLALAKQGLSVFQLPKPHWWVCNVGTEVYDEQEQTDTDWESLLGPTLNRQSLRQALTGIPGLTVQEVRKQGRHKFSLYYPEPATPRLLSLIMHNVGGASSGLRLIASVEESTGRALLDIVPANAGKQHAVAYMAQHYGLSADRVFFAGDSGNDQDVLLSGVCGTLVGNAPAEVQAEAQRMQQQLASARLYMAQANYGDGIIEGLRHYGFWPNEQPGEAACA